MNRRFDTKWPRLTWYVKKLIWTAYAASELKYIKDHLQICSRLFRFGTLPPTFAVRSVRPLWKPRFQLPARSRYAGIWPHGIAPLDEKNPRLWINLFSLSLWRMHLMKDSCCARSCRRENPSVATCTRDASIVLYFALYFVPPHVLRICTGSMYWLKVGLRPGCSMCTNTKIN